LIIVKPRRRAEWLKSGSVVAGIIIAIPGAVLAALLISPFPDP